MDILSTSILSPKHSLTNSANFLPRDFQEYHKTAPIFPRSTVLKNALKEERKEENSKNI